MGVKWYFLVLICIFLMIRDVERLFYVLIDHLYIFFGETSQVLCPFLNQVFVEFSEFSVYS